MNAALKRAAELLLLHGGPGHIARIGLGGRTLVLAYHDIIPEGEQPAGERSLHLPQRRFSAQLDEISARCQVVSLPDVLARGDGKPRVAITFDDAYAGAVTVGIDELSRRGMPATIFVPTECLGGATFWWDALAGKAGHISPTVRRIALEEGRGLDLEVRRFAGAELTPDLPAFARTASVDDLHKVLRRGNVTLGSHTVRHPNLTRLSPEELRAELIDSRVWLEREFPSAAIPWLAYPYGSTSPAVAQAAAEAGYLGAFRVDGGWIPRESRSVYDLPRLNVSAALSLPGFCLRLAGLLSR